LEKHVRETLGSALDQAAAAVHLDDLVAAEGKRQRQLNAAEPHRVLARLPCKVYITTNPDRLLTDALLEAGKSPREEVCPWYKDYDENGLAPRREGPPEPFPDSAHPLVYHLFGRFTVPESRVLTQDDYFDYLIGFTKIRNRVVPPAVRRA